MCTSGTTGFPKVIPYTKKMMEQVTKTMDSFVVLADVQGTEEKPANTYNLFPATLPNLGFWQCTQLSNYDWIRNFDLGNAPEGFLPKVFESYKPNLIAGLSETLSKVIKETPKELLKEVRQVITGGGPALQDLVELVEKELPNAKLLSVYGMTETGICFVTKYGEREKGYVIPEDIKVEIIEDEIVINGFKTGDIGSINDEGRIDLGISRLVEKQKFCK